MRQHHHLIHPIFSRRTAVQAGAIGLLGMGSNHLQALQAVNPNPPAAASAKTCIYIFLSGGLSQHQSFDPKRQAPSEVRGEFGTIATQTPGLDICEHLPGLAQRSSLWSVVRSLTHSSNDHTRGHYYMLTGRSGETSGFRGDRQPRSTDFPSIASAIGNALPSRSNLPPWHLSGQQSAEAGENGCHDVPCHGNPSDGRLARRIPTTTSDLSWRTNRRFDLEFLSPYSFSESNDSGGTMTLKKAASTIRLALVVVGAVLSAVAFLRGNYLLGIGCGITYALVAVSFVWLFLRCFKSDGSLLIWQALFVAALSLPAGYVMAFPASINPDLQHFINKQTTDRTVRTELQHLFQSDVVFASLSISTTHLKVVNVTIHGVLPGEQDMRRLRARITNECPTLKFCLLHWSIQLRDSGTTFDGLDRELFPVAELHDIGDPDDAEREVDGIHISGSALTDDHIAAIKALTDDTKPTNPNRYLIRGIEHTGLNTATNTWQTGHSQVYQKLRLVNGKWEIEEEGGGFGQW